MCGFPPTPPCTGCLGIVIWSSKESDTWEVDSTTASWVPLTLFRKIRSTLTSPKATSPEKVIQGPGLFERSAEVASRFIAKGNARLSLTACALTGNVAVARTAATSATSIPCPCRNLFGVVETTHRGEGSLIQDDPASA